MKGHVVRSLIPVLGLLVLSGAAADLSAAEPAAARAVRGLPPPDQLPPCPAPAVLVMRDGTLVKTREDWLKRRRGEVVALLQHYVYGYPPVEKVEGGTPPPVLVGEDRKAIDGAATWRHLRVALSPHPDAYRDLHLLIPNRGKGPLPVLLSIGSRIRCSPAAKPATTPATPPRTLQQDLGESYADVAKAMARGYVVAFFAHDQAGDGVRRCPPADAGPVVDHAFLGPRPLYGWGSIAMWAWIARRMVDVLEHQPGIDAKRIAVTGGSRTGAAAMLTGALDGRVAAVIGWQISPFSYRTVPFRAQSKWRGWLGRVYSEFDGRGDRIPVDYPMLAAAIAPRPLLLTASPTASYADPKLTAWILNDAAGAYRLLGADVEDFKPPWTDYGLRGKGPLRMHLRGGGHGYHADDWPAYLDFLDEQFRPKAR